MMYLYELVHSSTGVYDTYDKPAEALDAYNELAGKQLALNEILPHIRVNGIYKCDDEYSIKRIIG